MIKSSRTGEEDLKMKKKNFVALVFGIVGGLLFSLGMCMALLPEWGMFNEGVICGIAGAIVLVITWLVYRKMSGKDPIELNMKTVGKVLYGIVAALILGAGMCMIMVYEMMLQGIIVGVIGIVLLLLLIPMCLGWKE